MKTKQVLLWLTIVGLLTLSGCKSDNTPDDSSVGNVSVSNTALTFANDGGSQDITVTGSKEWTYISNVPEGQWLTLTQSEDKLNVKVAPNESGAQRTATIVIFGSKNNKKISIIQSAAEAKISFGNTDEIILTNKEESRMVTIETNTRSWSLEPLPAEIDWLKVTASGDNNILILKASANNSYDDRTATIIAKTESGEQFALKVTQKGVEKYIIPYIPGETYRTIDMMNFERERGNILQAYQQPGYDKLREEPINGIAQYITSSDVMPVLVYVQEMGDPKYTVAQTLIYEKDNVSHAETEAYMKLLEANGYELDKDLSQDLVKSYFRKDDLVFAQINITEGGSVISFKPTYPQTKAYPTFSKLPEGPKGLMDLINNPAVKYKEVLDFETKAGSTFNKGGEWPVMDKDNPDLYRMVSFKTNLTGAQEEGIRTYFFFTKDHPQVSGLLQSVGEVCLYFRDPSLAIRLEGKNQFVTSEFEDLLKTNGFEYDGRSDKGIYYYAKRVDSKWVRVLYVSAVRFVDVFDNAQALELGYYMLYKEKASGAQSEAAIAIRQAKKGDYSRIGSVGYNRYSHRAPRR